MFGMTSLFGSLKALAAEISRTTALFRAANDELAQRLRIDPDVDAEDRSMLPAGSNGEHSHPRKRIAARS